LSNRDQAIADHLLGLVVSQVALCGFLIDKGIVERDALIARLDAVVATYREEGVSENVLRPLLHLLRAVREGDAPSTTLLQ
jgi:hypothetical protein